MENYENLGTVGEGTYGVVMKCRHRETGQIVAIKKFKESDEDEQVRKTAMREVRILKQLRHDNIVNLIEMFRRKGKLYLVFEYLECTILGKIEKYPYGIPEDEVKKYMYQILKGIQYCHTHNIVHRDIKPENLLVSKSGVLKLCDFGFARTLEGQGSRYTDYVSTRWYRAPELLVGDTEYGKPVDIWAVGCMFAELITGVPLFPGKSDIDQLFQIINCFGVISDRHKEIFHQNPMFHNVELPKPADEDLETLEKRFPGFNEHTISFMKICLHQEPENRGTYEDLLRHPYFEGLDKWYEAEMKLLLEKDGIADFSKIRKRERTPTRKDKIRPYPSAKPFEDEEKRKKPQYSDVVLQGTGANKENELTSHLTSSDSLPNIRIQRMVPFPPYVSDQRREDFVIPPITHSNSFIISNNGNGQPTDVQSHFASLPTLSDTKHKPNKKKGKRKNRANGTNLSSNQNPQNTTTTPGCLYSSIEYHGGSVAANRSKASSNEPCKITKKFNNGKRK